MNANATVIMNATNATIVVHDPNHCSTETMKHRKQVKETIFNGSKEEIDYRISTSMDLVEWTAEKGPSVRFLGHLGDLIAMEIFQKEHPDPDLDDPEIPATKTQFYHLARFIQTGMGWANDTVYGKVARILNEKYTKSLHSLN